MKSRFHFIPALALVEILFQSRSAFAHAVAETVGSVPINAFYAGLLHPITSAEHLLPMIALALLAGQWGQRAGRWTIALFPMALVLGMGIGRSVSSLQTSMHVLNLISLAGLGMSLVFLPRIPFSLVTAAAGLVGLILGCRSGIDMAAAGVQLRFIPGVALTGIMTMALIIGWMPKSDKTHFQTLRRAAGGCFTAAGLIFLSNLLFGGSEPLVREIAFPSDEKLTLLLRRKHLSTPILLSLFLGSFGWGAAHAFTPGHGKAIVGAYLVGARANGRHAVFLGLTVTATHTLGVIVLGLVTLAASQYIVADRLYPWLGAASGFLVLAIGVRMLIFRFKAWREGRASNDHHTHFHDHEHSHSHGHDHHHHYEKDHDHHHNPENNHDHIHPLPGLDDSPVTWRSLLALGISGGLLPCPAALVLLLVAISQHRTALGLALVFAFSIGLAGVLTAVGLLFVQSGRFFERSPKRWGVARFLPVISSLVVALLGLLITIQSASNIRM